MKLSDDLRQSVLQAAMKGKLTKQLKEEGNADDLLKVINEERAKLVKEKKIKKSKPLPQISEDEIPFDIPENWRWIRLDECGAPGSFADGPFGSNLKKIHYTSKKEVRIIQLSNIGEFYWKDKNEKYTTYKHLESIKRCEVHVGDFVIAKMMPAGRAMIMPEIGTKVVLGSDAVKFTPLSMICSRYLHLAINSPMFQSQVYADAKGITRVRTSLTKLKSYILPLPPLAEQYRIVEKVEAIMAEIDELEKKENELEMLKKEFPEDMKASLLQAAMEGKLTKQKLDDMPSKNRLYEEVNDISLKYLNSDLPNLPKNWSYVFLKDVAKQKGGFAFKSQNYSDNGIRVIRISDFDENGINNKKVVKYKMDSSLEKYLIHNNDILLCMTGGTVGKNCLARVKDDKLLLNQRVADITATEYINYKYLFYCINMPINQSIIQNGKNSTNDNISSRLINKFIIPLPPLEEQMRIVAKLDELLPLCEELEEDEIK